MKYSKFTRVIVLVFVAAMVLTACKERTGSADATTTATSNSKEKYSDNATSSVHVYDENGRVRIEQTSSYYQLIDMYKGETKVPILLKIKKTETGFADSASLHKTFEVTAKSLADNEPVAWTKTFAGTELEVKDNTLLLVHVGGTDEEDLLTRYNLQNGERLFGSTYSDLRIAIPNVREKRFIGYTSQRAAAGGFTKEKSLLGTIEYAKGTAAISKLKIYLKPGGVADKMPTYTPEMVMISANESNSVVEDGKQVILMSADEKYTAADVSNFALQLTFYFGDDNESTTVVIPVKDDKIDLAAAKYDKQIFNINE